MDHAICASDLATEEISQGSSHDISIIFGRIFWSKQQKGWLIENWWYIYVLVKWINIGRGNGLSIIQRQAITWTYVIYCQLELRQIIVMKLISNTMYFIKKVRLKVNKLVPSCYASYAYVDCKLSQRIFVLYIHFISLCKNEEQAWNTSQLVSNTLIRQSVIFSYSGNESPHFFWFSRSLSVNRWSSFDKVILSWW